jgi:hypothetical protein
LAFYVKDPRGQAIIGGRRHDCQVMQLMQQIIAHGSVRPDTVGARFSKQ